MSETSVAKCVLGSDGPSTLSSFRAARDHTPANDTAQHQKADPPPTLVLEPPSAQRFTGIKQSLAGSEIGLIKGPSL